MLPQQGPTALSSTGEVAENRKSKLFQRRARFDDTHETWDDACLSSLFLSRLVQSTEVVAGLEDMVRHFLWKDEYSNSKARGAEKRTGL